VRRSVFFHRQLREVKVFFYDQLTE